MELLTRKESGILTLQFNRPQRKNAITAAMYQALADALALADSDADIKVVLIHGSEDCFTAGNDLEDFLEEPPQGDDAPVLQFLRQLSRIGKPLVAAVNGPAIGIGTTLLLHCDLVYAGEKTKFALPFTSLGLVPEAASSFLLPRMAGYQQAAEVLLLGQPFDAHHGKQLGFVNHVLPAEAVLPAARAAAEKLAALPGRSVRNTKALLRGGFRHAMETQMTEEWNLFKDMLTEPAAKEAFAAFLERRKPDFSGLD